MFKQVFNFKVLFALLLASLLLVGSLGISHAGMSMDMEGNMTDCPFMPGVSICNMSPLEMIAASQSFLQNVSLQNDLFLILSLLLAVAGTVVFARFFSPPDLFAVRHLAPKQSPPVSYNFLQEAFSNGILNPKLY